MKTHFARVVVLALVWVAGISAVERIPTGQEAMPYPPPFGVTAPQPQQQQTIPRPDAWLRDDSGSVLQNAVTPANPQRDEIPASRKALLRSQLAATADDSIPPFFITLGWCLLGATLAVVSIIVWRKRHPPVVIHEHTGQTTFILRADRQRGFHQLAPSQRKRGG
jgi:hypothetical protein